MKILFTCLQYIHASRWINQLKDSHHEVYIFDCLDKPIHKDLLWAKNITGWSKRKIKPFKGEYFLEKKMPQFYDKIVPYLKVTATQKLEEIIQEIKPDLVHSLEMQSQTYPLIIPNKKLGFKWAYFSWGSDLFLYQNNKLHLRKIREALSSIDYLFIDNKRDISLANSLSFKGKVLPVFPGGGGYDLQKYQSFIKLNSQRSGIVVKGYHHWAGRALRVLEAIEIITKKIKGYDIYVYSAHDSVIKKIEELNNKYSLNIKYSSRKNEITHEELLQKFGSARIAIGNNISDGIPNTLLESIILGAFPIQSNPGGATEDYIEHGNNGFLIQNPEDVSEIANLIEKAIDDEGLINRAFEKNQEIAKTLEYSIIREKVLKVYEEIEKDI